MENTGMIRGTLVDTFDLLKNLTEKAESQFPLVKYGREQIEWISAPLVEKAISVGDPIVNKLDERLSKTDQSSLDLRASIDALSSKIVTTEWFKKVDSVIGFQTLWNALKLEWDSAHAQSREEFMKGVQSRLVGLLDDKASRLAEAFWIQAHQLLDAAESRIQGGELTTEDTSSGSKNLNPDWDAIKQRLQKTWDRQVNPLVKETFVSPALHLYEAALTQYLSLKEAQVITFAEFLDGMRSRLGLAYSEKLEKPLLEFFNAAQACARGELVDIQGKVESLIARVKHSGNSTVGKVLVFSDEAIAKIKDKRQNLLRLPSSAVGAALQFSQSTFDYYIPPDGEGEGRESKEDSGDGEQTKFRTGEIRKRIRRVWRVVTKKAHRWSRLRLTDVNEIASKSYQKFVKNPSMDIYNKAKIPELRDRAWVCSENAGGIWNSTRKHVSSKTIPETSVDAIKFAVNLPFLIVCIALGITPESNYPEAERQMTALATSFWELLFWWRSQSSAVQEMNPPSVEGKVSQRGCEANDSVTEQSQAISELSKTDQEVQSTSKVAKKGRQKRRHKSKRKSKSKSQSNHVQSIGTSAPAVGSELDVAASSLVAEDEMSDSTVQF